MFPNCLDTGLVNVQYSMYLLFGGLDFGSPLYGVYLLFIFSQKFTFFKVMHFWSIFSPYRHTQSMGSFINDVTHTQSMSKRIFPSHYYSLIVFVNLIVLWAWNVNKRFINFKYFLFLLFFKYHPCFPSRVQNSWA